MVAALLRSPFPAGAVPFPGGPPGGGREPGGWGGGEDIDAAGCAPVPVSGRYDKTC